MSLRLKLFIGLCGLVAVSVASIRLTFWGFTNDGPAMEPTLFDGDRFVIRRFGAVHAGDIVVVYSPLDEVNIVKRVVAVGGDTVSEVNGELFVNGVSSRGEVAQCPDRAQLEPDPNSVCRRARSGAVEYLTVDSDNFVRDIEATLVPDGHFWLRGDHRDRSNDSNNPRIGAIPRVRIQGVLSTTY